MSIPSQLGRKIITEDKHPGSDHPQSQHKKTQLADNVEQDHCQLFVATIYTYRLDSY